MNALRSAISGKTAGIMVEPVQGEGGVRPCPDRFLQDLRVAVGEQAFYASLKDYAVSNFYQIATRADFFAAFSRHTQVDLEPVIQRYFSN